MRAWLRCAEAMHPVAEVSSHQAVAATAVQVQARAPRYHDPQMGTVTVEEALEERPPTRVLVQLIEDNDAAPFDELIQPELLRHCGRPPSDQATVVLIVPVQVGAARDQSAAGGRLAHLPRPRNEGHLAATLEVVPQHAAMKSRNQVHGTILRRIVQWSYRPLRPRPRQALMGSFARHEYCVTSGLTR